MYVLEVVPLSPNPGSTTKVHDEILNLIEANLTKTSKNVSEINHILKYVSPSNPTWVRVRNAKPMSSLQANEVLLDSHEFPLVIK